MYVFAWQFCIIKINAMPIDFNLLKQKKNVIQLFKGNYFFNNLRFVDLYVDHIISIQYVVFCLLIKSQVT